MRRRAMKTGIGWTEEEERHLWTAYKTQGSQTARQALIMHYAYLSVMTARRLIEGKPQQESVQDYIAEGNIALIRAVDGFDPTRRIKFETYAISLIRGAIMEMMRENDWVPRLVRDQQKAYDAACKTAGVKGDAPEEIAAIAEVLGMTSEAVEEWQRNFARTKMVSLDQDNNFRGKQHACTLADLLVTDDPEDDPWEQTVRSERSRALARELARLPERERDVLSRYYEQDKPFRIIGKELGISESRAYQLHTQAIRRLKDWTAGDRGEEGALQCLSM